MSRVLLQGLFAVGLPGSCSDPDPLDPDPLDLHRDRVRADWVVAVSSM